MWPALVERVAALVLVALTERSEIASPSASLTFVNSSLILILKIMSRGRENVTVPAAGRVLVSWLRLLVLPLKFESPPYSAMIVCAPCARVERLIAAAPLERITGDPKGELSSLNCTAPLGVPLPGGKVVSVAVKVTCAPGSAGLEDEFRTLVVAACKTVNV